MMCHRFFSRPAGLARTALLTVLVAAMGGLVLPGSALASGRGLLGVRAAPECAFPVVGPASEVRWWECAV